MLLLGLMLAGCAMPQRAAGPAAPAARGLGVLPPQGAPRAGCALYLYTSGPGQALVLAADSSTGVARISLDGVATDLPFAGFEGVPRSGFSPRMRYASEAAAIDLDLDMDDRRDMTGGAAIERGALRLDRPGGDSIALPVKGVIACVPEPQAKP
ncbi:hypothetical protein [Sphingomonas sanxanigenens]|uniref:Lipoprotein n=1 Tax=Sphingomonas sanxanigenens DSM 19645 = NX02 TaxID=1123269 RepID=W0AB91_9SPHN|nr:hypothetical protein [Sphingomonas sanxanigenens]AHE54366.1 hypothetical protein NX02_13360 [Sphingomonas sanxanigenens DSM 19645 = NX02]